jgi:hypothetical protein
MLQIAGLLLANPSNPASAALFLIFWMAAEAREWGDAFLNAPPPNTRLHI